MVTSTGLVARKANDETGLTPNVGSERSRDHPGLSIRACPSLSHQEGHTP